MSPPPGSTLDDPQQTIADLKRQLAESNAERDEAQAQQAATAEVLEVINSSPGDLGPVFDAILDKAMGLCEAAHGHVWIYDGERAHPVAVHGEPQLVEWMRRVGSVGPFSGSSGRPSPLGWVVRGEPIAHVADALEEEAYRSVPVFRELVDVGGIRTILNIALRKGDAPLGIIALYRQEVRPFSDKQIALLQNFAAQAVIALENARLITETREALDQQTATAEVLGVISSSPGDLAPVFDAMLDKAIRLSEATHSHLFTYDGDLFHLAAARGEPRYIEWQRQAGPVQPYPSSPLAQIKRGQRIVHVADIREEEVYRALPIFRESADLRGVRSQITVALIKDNILLGAMVVYRQEVRPFTDKQIALLQNFAAQAVIAMENAGLITETREALEQQTATAEVLAVINASPGDLAPVFDAILEKATRLCDAAFGILITIDGEELRTAAMRNMPERLAEALKTLTRLDQVPVVAGVVQGGRVLHIHDFAASDAYRNGVGIPVAAVEKGGVRSVLYVPLVKDDRVLGVFVIFRQEVRPFSDKQIALLQNFAAQAVIAMENAGLLGELRQRTEEVGELNRDLEARVAAQVDELGRVGRLKRFLAPQLAELIVSQGDEKILESHRREIVVVFCDLRGYTAFTETAEPEEVLDFLREYHGALGPLVSQFEGTLDQFSGDGIMVFFNDPVPCPDPAERAVNMAVAMRSAANTLIAAWRERGRDLGFGAGIAQGYATLGQIGFSERSGYTAIGTVCNVAARLCAEAKDGQILLSQLVNVALRGSVTTEQLGPLTLKGLTQPVVAYNVPLAPIQPALRVIEGGSPQTV